MNCPRCNGQLTDLGIMGARQHLRCRDCGADCAVTLEYNGACAKCPSEVDIEGDELCYRCACIVGQ